MPTEIDTPDSNKVFVLTLNADETTYTIRAEGVDGDNYLGWVDSENSGALVNQESAKNFVVTKQDDGTFNIRISDTTNRYLYLNATTDNNYFAFYKGTQAQDLVLIPVTGEVEAPCEHANTTTATVDATCTVAGSVTVTCNDCGETVSITEIPVIDHSYGAPVNNNNGTHTATCSACGDIVTEDHDFSDGKCACGAEKPDQGTTGGWVKKDVSEITANDQVIITMTYTDGTTWALSNDNDTSSAPTAVVVTVDGDKLSGNIDNTVKWNISNANGYLTFYPNGSTETWLYCTGTNNGVRVGTNKDNLFVVDSASGYLKHTATNRYLGVYRTNPDWRCYTNTTGNTANQTLGFYVWVEE